MTGIPASHPHCTALPGWYNEMLKVHGAKRTFSKRVLMGLAQGRPLGGQDLKGMYIFAGRQTASPGISMAELL